MCYLWDYDKCRMYSRLFPWAWTRLTCSWHLALKRQSVWRPLQATPRRAPSDRASLWWDTWVHQGVDTLNFTSWWFVWIWCHRGITRVMKCNKPHKAKWNPDIQVVGRTHVDTLMLPTVCLGTNWQGQSVSSKSVFFQRKRWRDSDVWSEENQISCNKYLEMLVFFVCRISKAPSSPPFYLSSRRFPASVGSGCWRPRLRWLLSDAATTGAPAPVRPARRWGHRGSVFPKLFFFSPFCFETQY